MSIRENLSIRLQEIREKRGLSITDFSEELEISRSLLQAILSGKANPRADTIEHIAEKLQISPISLLAPPSVSQQEDRLVQEVTDHVLMKIREILGENYE